MNNNLIVILFVLINKPYQQIKGMINYAYSQRNQYNSTPIMTFLCCVVFFDLTVFFFLTFLNICFENIVSDPPIWILVLLYLIMGADIGAGVYFQNKLTIKFFIDVAIFILLILSWATDIEALIFLSALVFIRFPEIVKFNDTMQDKVRSNGNLFVLYTLLKIIYLFTMIGHVFGCIFYAIDNNLIINETYQPIQDNPGLYYQGQLLCYTPIYSLSQINRYLYAMYYIFSLLATVAYGDIIPKNPYENAYVCFLLVISTISISYVIEQLLIVLRNNWDTITGIMQLLIYLRRKMKYLDSMLAKSATVKRQSRLTLINFMVYSLRHEAFNRPKFNRLTTNLQYRLTGESICMKKKEVNPNTLEGMNKILNMKIYEEYSVPRFLAIFLLPLLEQVYYPGNYQIINNQNVKDTNSLFIILSGSLKLGYGEKYNFKTIISERGKLLCWRQFIWENKNLNQYFKVETRELSQFYTFSTDTLRNIIREERIKSLSDDNFSEMLENYHMARMAELSKIYEDVGLRQQIEISSLVKSPQDIKQIENDEIENQLVQCWGCAGKTHMPLDCPQFHYRPHLDTILKSENRRIKSRKYIYRREPKSEKIRRKDNRHKNEQEQKYSMRQFLRRKGEQLENLKSLYYKQMPYAFERYQSYQNFYHQYNVKSYGLENE